MTFIKNNKFVYVSVFRGNFADTVDFTKFMSYYVAWIHNVQSGIGMSEFLKKFF